MTSGGHRDREGGGPRATAAAPRRGRREMAEKPE